jgi:hypothetical protein
MKGGRLKIVSNCLINMTIRAYSLTHILCHAKSSRKHPELTDHGRPLKRGKRDTPRIEELLKN